jgi:hypothetical protein
MMVVRRAGPKRGWLAGFAAAVMSAVGVAHAVCPQGGKQPLQQEIVTDAGTYDVWVFRGSDITTENIGGQEFCVEEEPFIPAPFGAGPVVAASNGDHFLTGEFSDGTVRIPASAYACEPPCGSLEVQYIHFPTNSIHQPFFVELFGVPVQTSTSAWVVGGVATPGTTATTDRIWVPQAGALGGYPITSVWLGGTLIPVKAWENHSRLVSYETETGTIEAHNLPGDWNQVLSPLWDPARHRIWFLESGTAFNRPRIGWFDPDEISSAAINDTEDFQDPVPLHSLICGPGENDGTCITYIDLPAVGRFAYVDDVGASTKGVHGPISMVADHDDRIWVAGFLSNNLLSLDMDSGEIHLYPLAVDPADDSHNAPVNCPLLRCGRGPALMDVDQNGWLFFSEFWSGKIGAIHTTTAHGNLSCKARNETGNNPCVTEYDVRTAFAMQHPEYPEVTWGMSGVLVDPAGVVWFGGGGSNVPGPAPLAGYISSEGDIVFLPAFNEPDLWERERTFLGQPTGELLLINRSLPNISRASNGVDLWAVDRFGRKAFLLKRQQGS